MNTARIHVLGACGSSVGSALLLATLVLVGSVSAYLDPVGSFCGTHIRQFQDVGLAFVSSRHRVGITESGLASKYSFYPRACRLGMIASFLVSLASLVLIGNN